MAAEGKPSKQDAEAPLRTPQQPLERMRQARAALLEEIGAALESGRGTARDAYRDHLRSIGDMDDEISRQRAERVRGYVEALDSAERGDQKGPRSARLAVEDELVRLDDEFRKRERDALSKCDAAIRETRGQVQQDIEKAFQAYVTAVKAVFAETPADALNPRTLVAMGELLAAAALDVGGLLDG